MVRNVKGEPSGSGSKVNGASRGDRGESDHNEGDDQNEGNGLERRVLRSRYLAVKNLISDKRDDITKADSEKFRFVFDEVECLHQLVWWFCYKTIKPLFGEALSRLNVVIRHYNVLHPENVIAYDDAVSALGKICHFHCNSIELAQIITVCLSCFLIKGDLIEAKVVNELLCSMAESSDTTSP
ncbi:hypothetical protein Lser_V15G13585 [Lactuca serriola]